MFGRSRIAPLLAALLTAASVFFFRYPAHAELLSVETALEIAVGIAEDDTHGYAHDTRMGDPDYDCASFVCSAFSEAGFHVSPWNNVGSMPEDFTAAGFLYLTGIDFRDETQLRRGDILLKEGHTEIYLGEGMMVGAHLDYDGMPGDSQDNEINVRTYYVRGYDGAEWTAVLRWPQDETDTDGTFLQDRDLFASAAIRPGDVNEDGAVDSADARLVLRAAVELEPIEPGTPRFFAADVNENGVIDAGDARLVLRASVELEALF